MILPVTSQTLISSNATSTAFIPVSRPATNSSTLAQATGTTSAVNATSAIMNPVKPTGVQATGEMGLSMGSMLLLGVGALGIIYYLRR